jgi:SSS family solute:Na+ symporter
VAAVFAAAMSSLDSALNSLSAVTLKDFYEKYFKPGETPEHYMRASKVLTAAWGVFCVGFALIFANAGEAARSTSLVLINAVGSLLYGPILAVFLMGMITKWATGRSAKVGVVAGVAVNIALWAFTDVSWMWWNVTGFVAAWAIGRAMAEEPDHVGEEEQHQGDGWQGVYTIVVVWFFALFAISLLLEHLLSGA